MDHGSLDFRGRRASGDRGPLNHLGRRVRVDYGGVDMGGRSTPVDPVSTMQGYKEGDGHRSGGLVL